jgi:hypothetical protein
VCNGRSGAALRAEKNDKAGANCGAGIATDTTRLRNNHNRERASSRENFLSVTPPSQFAMGRDSFEIFAEKEKAAPNPRGGLSLLTTLHHY